MNPKGILTKSLEINGDAQRANVLANATAPGLAKKQMPKESAKRLEEKNAKCTKTTKKASSTSKGKKWMKCVKSDSGGYKGIHWGQKGVKVSGKANTKRRKSFRARHKCSTAKANTPRGQACKDW